jgi:hypothetical protein
MFQRGLLGEFRVPFDVLCPCLNGIGDPADILPTETCRNISTHFWHHLILKRSHSVRFGHDSIYDRFFLLIYKAYSGLNLIWISNKDF